METVAKANDQEINERKKAHVREQAQPAPTNSKSELLALTNHSTVKSEETVAKANDQEIIEKKKAHVREQAKLRKRRSRAMQSEAKKAAEREKSRICMAKFRESASEELKAKWREEARIGMKKTRRKRKQATKIAKQKGLDPPVKPKRKKDEALCASRLLLGLKRG